MNYLANRVIFFICIIFFTVSVVNASSPTISMTMHTSHGSAKSINAAITQAIINGVAEFNGAYVESVKAIVSEDAIVKGYVKIGGNIYSPVNANIMSKGSISAMKLVTHGIILGYTVLDKKQVGDMWYVSVQLKIAKYHKIASRTKYSIAILPFRSINIKVPGFEVSQILNQKLVDKISNMGKFQVIDRNIHDLLSYSKEVSILSSGDVGNLNKARLKQMVGADYLLVGTINQFLVENHKREYYGTSFDNYEVKAIINFRLVEMATMEIHYSDTIIEKISENRVRAILANPNNNYKTLSNILLTKAAVAISNKVVNFAK